MREESRRERRERLIGSASVLATKFEENCIYSSSSQQVLFPCSLLDYDWNSSDTNGYRDGTPSQKKRRKKSRDVRCVIREPINRLNLTDYLHNLQIIKSIYEFVDNPPCIS